MEAVKIKNLNYSIKNKPILQNINFELKKDTIACILGPSGSGKYTQALRFIKKYSPSELKYDKRITLNNDKYKYIYRISYIHLPYMLTSNPD